MSGSLARMGSLFLLMAGVVIASDQPVDLERAAPDNLWPSSPVRRVAVVSMPDISIDNWPVDADGNLMLSLQTTDTSVVEEFLIVNAEDACVEEEHNDKYFEHPFPPGGPWRKLTHSAVTSYGNPQVTLNFAASNFILDPPFYECVPYAILPAQWQSPYGETTVVGDTLVIRWSSLSPQPYPQYIYLRWEK